VQILYGLNSLHNVEHLPAGTMGVSPTTAESVERRLQQLDCVFRGATRPCRKHQIRAHDGSTQHTMDVAATDQQIGDFTENLGAAGNGAGR
jgi:hypothetical protein